MTINQRRTYTEMLEILDNMGFLKSQIPYYLIEKMKLMKDTDWSFKYDTTIALENQKILYSTKVLYSYLYTEFIATDEKKGELNFLYEENAKRKYNPNNLFKKSHIDLEETNKSNLNMVREKALVLEKRKWYHKIFDRIKKLFNKHY